MIDFSTLQSITIPEGLVTQITDASGRVLWAVVSESNEPIVLEVEKITSDTYAGETTYTGEEFILLDIYPKTNGTVTVTYGGLTKTITDTSGAAEPNAQQVFFGTFNGVSDEVGTPASGTLTIEGDYRGVGGGLYKKTPKGVTHLYCSCVTAVIDLGSVKVIPNGAFKNCTKLTRITIPDSVTTIGSAYGIDGAFDGCTGLTSVTIPSSVTRIGGSAFNGCTGLTSVTIPSSVTDIDGSAFDGCTGLTSVTIPSSVTRIGGSAFNGCTGLTNIIVDSGNEYYSSEGGILFNKDKTTICVYPTASGHYTIPSSVTQIGSYTFYGCTGLTSVTIPSSVTQIGSYTFYGCTGLTSVTIPSSVTQIGDGAFGLFNENTRTVTMLSATPAILSGDSTFDYAGRNKIIVPAGSGDTYKAAEYWSEYADYITEVS